MGKWVRIGSSAHFARLGNIGILASVIPQKNWAPLGERRNSRLKIKAIPQNLTDQPIKRDKPMNHEKQERRAAEYQVAPPAHLPPDGTIVEPDDSMFPISNTTVPPGDYEEVMRKMKERMGEI